MRRDYLRPKKRMQMSELDEELYQALRQASFDRHQPQAGIVRTALRKHLGLVAKEPEQLTTALEEPAQPLSLPSGVLIRGGLDGHTVTMSWVCPRCDGWNLVHVGFALESGPEDE